MSNRLLMKTVVKYRELNLVLGDNLEVGMVGGGRFKREGTYVYLWMIHAVVWQEPAPH